MLGNSGVAAYRTFWLFPPNGYASCCMLTCISSRTFGPCFRVLTFHRNVLHRQRMHRARSRPMITVLLLFLTFAFLIVGGSFYYKVFLQISPDIPPNLRNPYTVHFALDALIWERSFPSEARRKHLLSMAFSAIAALCAGILLSLQGQFVTGVCFACLFALGAGRGLMRWRKYKDRL